MYVCIFLSNILLHTKNLDILILNLWSQSSVYVLCYANAFHNNMPLCGNINMFTRLFYDINILYPMILNTYYDMHMVWLSD